MSTDTLAAAHIITADAVALGDPEIIAMTRADETGAADEIERINVPATYATDLDEIQTGMRMFGWRVTGDPTLVETGYFIVDVERTEG